MLKDFKIPSSKYFIIDCDVGGDDALCIIMAALFCKKYDKVLLGVTCVAGNTTLPNVVTNALISCKIAGINVPIFKGIEFNLFRGIKKYFRSSNRVACRQLLPL